MKYTLIMKCAAYKPIIYYFFEPFQQNKPIGYRIDLDKPNSTKLPNQTPRNLFGQGVENGSDDQHDGVHCADCASEMGDGTSHMNPYACMLIPEKIQALETHKNSAVAKRCFIFKADWLIA